MSGHVVTWKKVAGMNSEKGSKATEGRVSGFQYTLWGSSYCGGCTWAEHSYLQDPDAELRGLRAAQGPIPKGKEILKKASERKVTEEFAESGICQKNNASNGGIWDCTGEKTQQEHSMLEEAWTWNVTTFSVLRCRDCKFMIYWVMMMQRLQRETSTGFQLEWDTGLLRSNHTPHRTSALSILRSGEREACTSWLMV